MVSWSLFKVMIPTLIIVKIAQETAAVVWLNWAFNPITELIGLPNELTVVLTTTMLTNPYAGLIVLAATDIPQGLTVSQASILASFMLFTHALPVEAAISRLAGVKATFIVIARLLSAIIYCFLMAQILNYFDIFQSQINFVLPQFEDTRTLSSWLINQLKGLLFIQLVIVCLLIVLEILKNLGIEKLIAFIMQPFLKVLGIGQSASTIVVVGLTIGLGFGGGLMIKDVRTGKVNERDAISALLLINLFHSLLEDTSLVMLLNPSLFLILLCRAIFVFAVTFVILKLIRILPDKIFHAFLINHKAFPRT